MLSRDNDDEEIPPQFQHIIRETFDTKNDIEFGYTISRSEATYNLLLGSRAYQRAVNRLTSEEAKRREEEAELERQRNGR